MIGTSTTLVVPCFNESARLDAETFVALSREPSVKLLFVDDGSQDDTALCLGRLAEQAPERIATLLLPTNVGKGEAVRRGLLHALAQGAARVGYIDADLATPIGEVTRLLELFSVFEADVLLVSRVRLLGSDIQRRPLRHYLGRIFVSAVSLAFRLSVYDTQCGAKLFRATPELEAALNDPFFAKWIFDVELIARLMKGTRDTAPLTPVRIVEQPLNAWRDVSGSKLRMRHGARAVFDLLRIAYFVRS